MGLLKKLFNAPPDIERLEMAGDIEGLIKALSYKSDKQPRIDAATALGALRNPSAIPALIEALDDLLVRDTAAKSLQLFGESAVNPLIEALDHTSESVRLYAMQTLQEIGDPRAIEPLSSLLTHEKPQMRKAAIEALCKFDNGAQLSGVFIPLLRDVDAAVRETAVIALGDCHDPQAIDTLVEVLHGDEQVLKGKAVMALGTIGDKRAMKPLITAYEKGTVRADIVMKALGQLRDGQSAPVILSALDNDNQLVWQAASDALNELDEKAVNPLIEALSHEKPRVRAKAALALGKIGDARAVEALSVLFHDEDSDVRTEAATALGTIGNGKAIQHLTKAVHDKNAEVRWCGVWGLWQVGDTSAVEPLIYALSDSNDKIRELAVVGLRATRDSRAIQPLIGALDDKSESVQQSAIKSLAALGGIAVEPLIQALESGNKTVKTNALSALKLLSGEDFEIPDEWRGWMENLLRAM